MSDELQAEIDRLKAENARLNKDLAASHDDLKEVRGEARDRRHAAKTLEAQVAELTADRDRFKAAAEADPENLRKEIEGYKATVRDIKHEREYAAVLGGLRVTDPARRADLIRLAGYQPEGDEPDHAKITAAFHEALKGRPWLVDQAPPGGGTTAPGGAPGATTTAPPAVPGPGSDRGQSVSSPPSQATAKPAGRL